MQVDISALPFVLPSLHPMQWTATVGSLADPAGAACMTPVATQATVQLLPGGCLPNFSAAPACQAVAGVPHSTQSAQLAQRRTTTEHIVQQRSA